MHASSLTPPPAAADQTTPARTPNELIALAAGERHVSRQRNSPDGSGQEVGIAGKATADTDAGADGARPATSTDLGCDITAIVIAPRRGAQAGERPHNLDVAGARRWIKRALLGVLALGATVGCAGRPLSKPDGNTGASGVGGVLGAAGGESAGTQGRDTCSADADCPPIECAIAPCSRAICALGDDGFHHCTAHLPVGSCQPDDPSCCAGDVNCPSGQSCLAGSPQVLPRCGGIARGGNSCVSDFCQSDADCVATTNLTCTDSHPRVCASSSCRSNADCTRGPGGACVLGFVTFVTQAGPCLAPSMFCRYSNDACRSGSDCAGYPDKVACLPNGLSGPGCVDSPDPGVPVGL